MNMIHDVREGSAASEARLWDDGIQAMLERRDSLLVMAACGVPGAQDEADDLSAQAGVQQFRLLAFMLANRVTSADLIAAGAR